MLALEKVQDHYLCYLQKGKNRDVELLTQFIEEYDKKKQLFFTNSLKGLSINKLNNILYLDLSNGRFTKSSKFRYLSNLQALDLSYNDIDDLSFLRDLPELQALFLNHCNLKKYDDNIALASNLRLLDLSHNQIDYFSQKINELNNLTALNISNNEIRRLPFNFSKLKHLVYLDASNNKIYRLEADFGRLIELIYLDLSKNNLHRLPTGIRNLKHLVHLNLMINKLTNLPPETGFLFNLQYLNINKNKLKALPAELSQLNNLTTISYLDNPYQEMPALKKNGIEILSPFLASLKEKKYDYFTIRLNKELKKPIAQYLSFFSEYVALTKKEQIKFEVRQERQGLLVIMEKSDKQKMEDLKKYFYEYVNLAREQFHPDKLNVMQDLSQQDRDSVKLKLESEIENLTQTLDKIGYENKKLKDENLYLRELSLCIAKRDIYPDQSKVNLIDSPKLYASKSIHKVNRKKFFEYVKYLVSENETLKAIQILKEYYRYSENNKLKNQIILFSAQYNEIREKERMNLLCQEEVQANKTKINNGLISLIDDELASYRPKDIDNTQPLEKIEIPQQKKKLFTKSRYKTGKDCPVKLYYSMQPQYYNKNKDDKFLQALSEGGYQVGELAKVYFPGGIDVNDTTYAESLEKTNQLLKKEKVTIFEAAIRWQNYFIRVDILQKNGDKLEIIEVKSKAYDKYDTSGFLNAMKNKPTKEWKPYLEDVAFQHWITQKAFPEKQISSALFLLDKNAKAGVDKLNQKFSIDKIKDRQIISKKYTEIASQSVGEPIMVKIPVNDIVESIWQDKDDLLPGAENYQQEIELLYDIFNSEQKPKSLISEKCAVCEYRIQPEIENRGFKSGFKTCWSEALYWTENEFEQPLMIDIWNFRGKDRLISEYKFFMRDLTPQDIITSTPDQNKSEGLSVQRRQWLQVQKTLHFDKRPYVNIQGLEHEMKKWVYPLHFIDFETTTLAIPFKKGSHPYESIAFQFSHHTIDQYHNIEHQGEYLNTQKGHYPNFDFIRALKQQLENDTGTIFRYAAHENSILNAIYFQLKEVDEKEVPDKYDLIDFIKNITQSSHLNDELWIGERNMVDMMEVIKKYIYLPDSNGSLSIKKILPAVLNESHTIRDKYSQPIYGSKQGIKSLNFENRAWVKEENGKVINPYRLLANTDVGNRIVNGGEATSAYARLQFTNMDEKTRKLIQKALLRYCELDTFAMVLIWEYWNELTN